jgi:hypothetical protein
MLLRLINPDDQLNPLSLIGLRGTHLGLTRWYLIQILDPDSMAHFHFTIYKYLKS